MSHHLIKATAQILSAARLLKAEAGVVKVVGDDAGRFLNGLVTVDIATVAPGRARFAALLTPQGKIVADFIVATAPAEDGGGFFLEARSEDMLADGDADGAHGLPIGCE